MVRCVDNSLYTGVTTDLSRRITEHNDGGAASARYTRARRPVHLAYSEPVPDRATACQREYAIKSLKRYQKEQLCLKAHQETKRGSKKEAKTSIKVSARLS